MPTDVPAFKARLLEERAAVVAELAVVDMADEQAKYDAAVAVVTAAQTAFNLKVRRWTLVQEKLDRLQVLDAQIALITP